MAFDMDQLNKSVEAINKGFDEYKAANDARLKELEKKGGVDPVLEEKLAKIDADMNKHMERLDQFELSMKRDNRKVVDENGNEIDLEKKASNWAKLHSGVPHRECTAEQLDEYKSAFVNFMRTGEELMGPDERKALSVGTDPSGGYLVTPDTSGAIVKQVYETSPIRAYANVVTISTARLEGTYDDDEAAAEWAGEATAASETDTPDLGIWGIDVHELRAMPKATQQILDDAAWDMEAWLAEKVADKFSRTENAAFVTGNGVRKPRGFLTYSDWASAGTYEKGAIEQFDTGVNGGFAAAPAGGDVLINALYGLKQAYRNNAVWAMNRATLTLVRKLKDSDGAYLWAPGIAAGQPATILGYPMASFEDMPDPATGSLSIAVADWRQTYTIVDRQGIRVLRDPYSSKPHVLFFTRKRVGGDVVNFESIKLINMKA